LLQQLEGEARTGQALPDDNMIDLPCNGQISFISARSLPVIKGISKNPTFYYLNPSPFSRREGYTEFLEMPYIL
jgi:hypothetical protein